MLRLKALLSLFVINQFRLKWGVAMETERQESIKTTIKTKLKRLRLMTSIHPRSVLISIYINCQSSFCFPNSAAAPPPEDPAAQTTPARPLHRLLRNMIGSACLSSWNPRSWQPLSLICIHAFKKNRGLMKLKLVCDIWLFNTRSRVGLRWQIATDLMCFRSTWQRG